MKTIIVASQNPIKLQAVQNGFTRMFPDEKFDAMGFSAPSGVNDQPASDEETLLGARNRAMEARAMHPNAHFWVGVEGGIQDQDGEMTAFAWVVVLSPVHSGKGRTGTFFLPPEIAALVRQGVELGEADDIVFGRTNTKQANGAVGLLTGDVIDRAELYEGAVVLALIPFVNPNLYD